MVFGGNMKTTICLLLVVPLAACSDARLTDSLTGPPPDSPATQSVSRETFALVQLNGQPLPGPSPYGAGEWDYDGKVYELTGVTLTLNSDGTYTEVARHREVGRTYEFSQGWTGTYQWKDATTLEFAINGGRTTATLTSKGLTWAWGGYVLTFERR
jgi:hypothetical protein